MLSAQCPLDDKATLRLRHPNAFPGQQRTYLIPGMTSPVAPPPRRPTPGRPNREQLVAALLVGTVVVLLGFASGLGLGPAATITAQSAPASGPPEAGPAPAGTSAALAATASPPVAYVVEPVPPAAAAVVVESPSAPTSTLHPSSPAPSSSAVPSDPSTSSAPTPPTCSPSLLTALLKLLLPGASESGVGLLGLGALLTSLTQVAATATSLLTAPPGRLLEQVTGLLDRPGTMSPGEQPSAVAPACTADVSQALRLVAAGQDVRSAVRTVDR